MDIILTGIPRSGTTLTCNLLNKLPDVVALNEPMNMGALVKAGEQGQVLEEVERFFASQRASLQCNGIAVTRLVAGKITLNMFNNSTDETTNLRKSNKATVGEMCIKKPLSSNFLLALKHPNAFSSLLPLLVQRWTCYAIVRNPLAILLSWNSIPANVRKGHAPMAEAFDPELKAKLSSEPDEVLRQLLLIEWFFAQYYFHLPKNHILRYEDIIDSKGQYLKLITEEAAVLDEPLQSKNCNPLYSEKIKETIGPLLLKRDSCIWDYYDKSEIELSMSQ